MPKKDKFEQILKNTGADKALATHKQLKSILAQANKTKKIDASLFMDYIDSLDMEQEDVDALYAALEQMDVDMEYSEKQQKDDDYTIDTDEPQEKDTLAGVEDPTPDELDELEEEDLDESGDDPAVKDIVSMYLAEMGQYAMLSHEEEIACARAIGSGRRAKDTLADYDAGSVKLTAKEQRELTELVRKGEEAKERLTNSNLRLVVSIAKRYARTMPLLDLVQEGNIGLMRAIEKFDVERGYRFTTYATWWIRQAITRAISDQSHMIRLPVHFGDSIGKVIRVSNVLAQKLGREPTATDIAKEINMPVEKVIEIMCFAKEPASLDSPVNETDDSSALFNFVADENSASPLDAVAFGILQQKLDSALSTLAPREAMILRLRFGMEDGRQRTLEQVGKELNITRERVRQIEAKALRKLSMPKHRRQFADFIHD